MLSQTPWLKLFYGDFFAIDGDTSVVCGESIVELFDIPVTVTSIRLSIHKRPSKWRVRMRVPEYTSARVIFDDDSVQNLARYADDKLNPYCGRTVYLECEYKE